MATQPAYTLLSRTSDKIQAPYRFIYWTPHRANANMLRILIDRQVSTPAIHSVIIHENSSILDDEILAMRLGQVVINHKLVPDKSRDVWCTLKVQGPTIGPDFESLSKRRPVTAGSLVIAGSETNPALYASTGLVDLRAGQAIDCDCLIRWDVGKTHAKWQPCSTIVFKDYEDEGRKGFLFEVRLIGNLDLESIVSEAHSLIGNPEAQKTNNAVFYRPAEPH